MIDYQLQRAERIFLAWILSRKASPVVKYIGTRVFDDARELTICTHPHCQVKHAFRVQNHKAAVLGGDGASMTLCHRSHDA